MTYDLVIKNGTVIDGSGMPRYRADVGITGGKITNIGRIKHSSAETIDAEGHIVAPGFVDGHTHMDAQVSWDPLGTCSCWHGVTSVVMGNCGFTLAPCKEDEKDLVMRNLERAEDISPEAMMAGINWTWETFPEYLDAVDALPKGINYAGYIGHSALRTYVMGERAFSESATEDDLEAMGREVEHAIKAGAIGFSTSRTPNHITPDNRPVASRIAEWSEVEYLVNVMGELNAGIFEIAHEQPGRDEEKQADYFARLKSLAVESGVPVTWGMFGTRRAPDFWRPWFDLLDDTAAAGGRMFAQVHSRALSVLLSFKTSTPFDKWAYWQEVRALPTDEQLRALRDPEVRDRLVAIASKPYDGPRIVGAEARPPNWEWVFPMYDMSGPRESVAAIAQASGKNPVEVFIELAVDKDLDLFFMQPIANEDQDDALEMMKHPRSVVTFSDSGAHVSQIMDSSLQTHVFSHWVREKEALSLEQAVRSVTCVPATLWGLHDRGLIRTGMAADITVFDPAAIAPQMPEVVHDLPAGARRLVQKADGILATVVNGQQLMDHNEHTGALPGQLLRGPLAAA